MPPKKVKPKHTARIYHLMVAARRTVLKQGHRLGRWFVWPKEDGALAHCQLCKESVGVLTNPYPNESCISGVALLKACKKMSGKTKQ